MSVAASPRRTIPTSPTGADAAPIADYATAIAGTLGTELARRGLDPAGVALEVEPGRSLHADAGVHLTTVRGLKRQTRADRVGVGRDRHHRDVSRRPADRARIFPAGGWCRGPTRRRLGRADIVGQSCGFDVLAQQIEFPRAEVDDVIAFLDTGAYQDACANNWNALPRPGTVLVHGAEAEWIKRPETVDEVFARDLIPERLR